MSLQPAGLVRNKKLSTSIPAMVGINIVVAAEIAQSSSARIDELVMVEGVQVHDVEPAVSSDDAGAADAGLVVVTDELWRDTQHLAGALGPYNVLLVEV